METISPEFSLYIKEKFGYEKKDYDVNVLKEIPNTILQKDKLVKLTVNEELKNIIRGLSYDEIKTFSSLTEKKSCSYKNIGKTFYRKRKR